MRIAAGWGALVLPVLACSAATPEWRTHAEHLDAASPVDRFVQASALFLGTPYVDGPLGEGEEGGPDADPRVDFSGADCVTYLEQSLALAIAPHGEGASDEAFLRALDAIRYRGGRVGFETRNHYMVRDWIPANAWLVEDVTAEVAGDQVQEVRRTIDRATFLKNAGGEPVPGKDDAEEISVRIAPREAWGQAQGRLRSGDLIFWVGAKEGIFVMHTGLCVRNEDGELLFRHASSRAEKVLDESFSAYADAAGWAEGFLALRMREEIAP